MLHRTRTLMIDATYHNDPPPQSIGAPQRAARLSGPFSVRRSLLGVLACALVIVVGCATASFQGGIYDDGVVRYRVGERSAGWQRLEIGDNDLAFHHEQFGTVSINSTCADYSDVPEQALMNHLLFGMRERTYRTEEMVTLDGRGAWHVVVDAQLDGVPLVLEVYLVHKDGCVYDLSRISAPARFEAGRAGFEHFVQGFKVLRTTLE